MGGTEYLRIQMYYWHIYCFSDWYSFVFFFLNLKVIVFTKKKSDRATCTITVGNESKKVKKEEVNQTKTDF